MSPSNDYPFYRLRKFILSCVLFRLFRSTNRTLTLLCTHKNSHTASHLLIACKVPGGLSLSSPQVPLSLSLHSHRSLLSSALACPFRDFSFQFPCSAGLLLAAAYQFIANTMLFATYYTHISPTVNNSLQYSTFCLILPPCFPTLPTRRMAFFYPAGFSQLWGFGIPLLVTPPVRSAASFSPGTRCQDRLETVNITPHFTVNRPCPCAARTP